MTEIVSQRRRRRFSIRSAPDQVLHLEWGAATDVGLRRRVNEDSVVAMPGVFAVADGLGGHSAGDVASEAAVTHLARAARRRSRFGAILLDGDVDDALIMASADIAAATADAEGGGGTTVAGIAVVQYDGIPALQIFNIGDSRVYQLVDGTLTQLTVDHSFVQDLVAAGQLAPELAEFHPEANVITRALGFGDTPHVDRWIMHPMAGARVLVCSDGLTRELSTSTIRSILRTGASPQDTATALVEAAVLAGGRDNVTVAVVDVIAAPEFSATATEPLRAIIEPEST